MISMAVLLFLIALSLGSVEGSKSEKTAYVGDTVTMSCGKNLSYPANWEFVLPWSNSVTEICVLGEIVADKPDRYSIAPTPDYSLTIYDVNVHDAGYYTCIGAEPHDESADEHRNTVGGHAARGVY